MLQEKAEGISFFYVLDEHLDIVYADDDPILREFAQVNLASDTSNIRVAADGLEALRLILDSAPDIILLDLEMPELDGFGVLAQLAADERLCRIPVIVVTGREDVAAIDRAYQIGATSFVVKPLNWRQLSYQIKYVHRNARNQMGLLQAGQAAKAQTAGVTERLKSLALAGSRFVGSALTANPALKPAAMEFASALCAAMQENETPVKAVA